MSLASEIGQRIREAIPDVESVLIVLLCIAVLLMALKSINIDVLDNLTDMRGDDLRRILFPLVLGVLSVLVECVRDALEEPTETTDSRDPFGDSEPNSDGETEGERDGETEEHAAETEKPVEFVGT